MNDSSRSGNGLWESLRKEDSDESWANDIPAFSEREETESWSSELKEINPEDVLCAEYEATAVYRADNGKVLMDSDLSERWEIEGIEAIEEDDPWAYFGDYASQSEVSSTMRLISEGQTLDSAMTSVYENNSGVAERLQDFTEETGYLQEKYREDFSRISMEGALTSDQFWIDSDTY